MARTMKFISGPKENSKPQKVRWGRGFSLRIPAQNPAADVSGRPAEQAAYGAVSPLVPLIGVVIGVAMAMAMAMAVRTWEGQFPRPRRPSRPRPRMRMPLYNARLVPRAVVGINNRTRARQFIFRNGTSQWCISLQAAAAPSGPTNSPKGLVFRSGPLNWPLFGN